ncbi:PREDICTED: uncharacterized protein LOC109180010 [Ipomoea nil]|uniref:uncharacterized protein LOC109180010 n=1 Tax=Ipomoea nil TaxID=35883 RepID=UPI000901F3E5|nr:PREDICTED: uncharacterized protein LOC109180010 [Ipomoea nil]
MAMVMSPKDHIEDIRRRKFSIEGDPNSLREDLHQAVKNLSAELYSKDVHFLMEIIQNAEDNEYDEGVKPSLEFVITSKDITETGAKATLLIFNNEKGFSSNNVESICSVGRSTKKGKRKSGYIGEKGIGFKSVFLITARPYIFSNGYQIRFSEEPCEHCGIGFIVPEWVDGNPILGRINQIYGSSTKRHTTTMVLPLKSDKVAPVKQQLSSIHPELLLFLSKIRALSVREENQDPKLKSVSAVSISSEKDLVRKKNIDAESFLLVLSADEKAAGSNGQCSYHMWRQRFPVKQECRVGRRMEVDEWAITLAFPYGERLNRGNISPGIYAFLPTEMVTNFPFIIQADFLLSSSREAILLDNKWNKGILECVSVAFLAAFTSLVKANQDAPTSTLVHMFNFLPLKGSPYSTLNSIKDSIREKLLQEDIMPCQSYTTQKFFRKPNQVGRLKPAFWTLVDKARNQGVSFLNISSHGKYILNQAFDQERYNEVLKFLDVKYVEDGWYSRCIQSSDLVLGVSEDLYLELLLFVADNWGSFSNTSMLNVPLLKYTESNLHVALSSVNSDHLTLFLCSGLGVVSWQISWNREFRCVEGYFIAESTQKALHSSPSKWKKVFDWLCSKVGVRSVDVYDYAVMIRDSLIHDRKLVLAYAHFLYHSFKDKHLSATQICSLGVDMPLVDDYGRVATKTKHVVVPANGSKWVQLLGSSNPWKKAGYVELGGEYLHAQTYAGVSSKKEELLPFLKTYAGVLDIPNLPPPDASLSSMASPLTRDNAFLLLGWIGKMEKKEIPERFLKCIREGSWLRVRVCGNPGYRPPSQSFLPSSSWGDHLQNRSLPVDIPLVDREFYGNEISGEYKEALRTAGVMSELKEASEFIGKHFMSLYASSTLTKGDVISMLNFIRYLGSRFLPADNFINSIKDKSWVQTTQGNKTPGQSVFLDKEWAAASQISNIPFLDQNHYGQEILAYKEELKLLGVTYGFNYDRSHFQLVVSNLKPSANLTSLSAEVALLALTCIGHLKLCSSDSLCIALAGNRCLKTVSNGFRSPAECFLPDPTWACLLQVFDVFPCIDEKFYGSKISSFKNELQMLGVVARFEAVSKSFAQVFRQQTSKCTLSKSSALSLLECYRKLKKANCLNLLKSYEDIGEVIQEVKWLRTRLGSACTPKECILFGKDWEAISSVSLLPFLDDAYYDQGILEYKAELYSMGVSTTFRKGSKFVPAGLRLPKNPSEISPSVACSLLLCLKNLQEDVGKYLISVLLEKLDHKWIKTQAGYRSPKQCLLFGSSWNGRLKQEDGPFIDDKFYGSPDFLSYTKELESLGVVVDAKEGCSLVADYLDAHSNRATINRIYTYLNDNGWVHSSDESAKIWIPNGENIGKWVSPKDCVLHDKTNLFGSHLFVLDKYYSNELLVFFSRLGVNSNPSLEHYLKLWKEWECAERRLLTSECCAFWEFIVNHWSSKTQKLVAENLSKLPVCSVHDDGILLLDRNDVFIADDLYKKELFEQSCVDPLFVWYPQPSLPSLPRTKLLNIYTEIGVGALSESAQNMGLSSIECAGLEVANPDMTFIGKTMFTLILGFLAQPSLEMEAEKRHELVRRLVNTSFLKLKEAIAVEYRLSLSSGKILIAKARRMMVWERERSKFFIAEIEKSDGYQGVLEYATYYSEEVSKGILWEKEDALRELAELIRLGFIFKFDKVAIGFLMKINNLQVFKEDELFLSSVLPAQ